MIFVGALSSNIFYTKVKPEQLSYDPYLSNNGLRMSQADSTFTYSQDTSDSTLILTPYTMIASSVSTLSLSIQQVSSLDSDISFNWGSISSLSIYSNSIASILVDLSCSISGASDIKAKYKLKPELDFFKLKSELWKLMKDFPICSIRYHSTTWNDTLEILIRYKERYNLINMYLSLHMMKWKIKMFMNLYFYLRFSNFKMMTWKFLNIIAHIFQIYLILTYLTP